MVKDHLKTERGKSFRIFQEEIKKDKEKKRKGKEGGETILKYTLNKKILCPSGNSRPKKKHRKTGRARKKKKNLREGKWNLR